MAQPARLDASKAVHVRLTLRWAEARASPSFLFQLFAGSLYNFGRTHHDSLLQVLEWNHSYPVSSAFILVAH